MTERASRRMVKILAVLVGVLLIATVAFILRTVGKAPRDLCVDGVDDANCDNTIVEKQRKLPQEPANSPLTPFTPATSEAVAPDPFTEFPEPVSRPESTKKSPANPRPLERRDIR